MKKKLLIIFVVSLLINLVKGQDFSIRLFVMDGSNRKDTIEFGLNNSSTLGIDSSFGEQDIYGQPWDSLDMRIIQRDSIEHHCLMETNWFGYPLAPEIYFDDNRDFKIDYRPTGIFGTINMNFEILIKSTNPPIFITTDFSGISANMFEGWSALHLLGNNCINAETKSIYFFKLNDTIYISNDTLTTLVAEFQHEVSVEETNSKSLTIYPNPAQTEINVEADISTFMKLYDIFGREIKMSIESKLSICELDKGLYIVRIFDKNGKQLKTEKLIKE